MTLLDLFKHKHVYEEGGGDEAQIAYHTAWKAIFEDKEPVARYTQKRCSHKNAGESRYILFEMWPLEDPVNCDLTMLVNLSNVTHQKLLEAELKQHRDILEK